MGSMNKAILLGRLGKDPELRSTQGGAQVCNFSVATSEKWKDKGGQAQEKTEWHNVVAWGRTAEMAAQYLNKGSEVLLEGRLQTRSWDDKSGNKRYTTEIVADRVTFVGSKREGVGQVPQSQQAALAAQQAAPPQQTAVDDDLPF